MKKIMITMIAVLGMVSSNAKDVIIIKKGGKKCKEDKSQICYDYIKTSDREHSFRQNCEGIGINQCPKVGIVSVGGLANFDFEGLVVNVESEIIRGETKKKGIIFNEDGHTVAYYSWNGRINDDDIIEYEIIINDDLESMKLGGLIPGQDVPSEFILDWWDTAYYLS